MLSTLGLASGSRTGQERCREAAPWGPGWRRRGECESWRGPSSMRGEDPSPGPGLDPLQELGWPAAAVAIKCCGVCWWRCPLSLLLERGAGGSRDRGHAPWGSQHPGAEQGGLGLWRWSPWRPPRRRAGTPQLTAWGQHDSPCTGTPRGPCQKEDSHRHRARLKAARSRAERSTRPRRGKYSLGSTATLIQTSQLPHSPLLGCFRWTRLWAWDVCVPASLAVAPSPCTWETGQLCEDSSSLSPCPCHLLAVLGIN